MKFILAQNKKPTTLFDFSPIAMKGHNLLFQIKGITYTHVEYKWRKADARVYLLPNMLICVSV